MKASVIVKSQKLENKETDLTFSLPLLRGIICISITQTCI